MTQAPTLQVGLRISLSGQDGSYLPELPLRPTLR